MGGAERGLHAAPPSDGDSSPLGVHAQCGDADLAHPRRRLPIRRGHAFTGGSDKEFFGRVARAGHEILWIDEAHAYEWYPLERITRRWILHRSFRLGTNAVHAEARRSMAARLPLVVRAGRFLLRAIAQPVLRPTDPGAALAWAAWDAGRAAGLIVGLLGGRYDEYASRHDGQPMDTP